jgi:outer membrane receptor for Fe3+-dicitrate
MSNFSGEDPGKLTLRQFEIDPDRAVTPYNHNWVDRYTGVLRWEIERGDWLFQTKAWLTHQDIDSRSAANLGGVTRENPFGTTLPQSTTLGYEDFNNGGIDVRARMKWGEDGMFRGSALTFGTMLYHGDAPFKRYNLNNTAGTAGFFGPGFLGAPRGTSSNDVNLDQDRDVEYQSVFIEDLIRIGRFHIVPSLRFDHENIDVDATAAPYLNNGLTSSRDADKLVPL